MLHSPAVLAAARAGSPALCDQGGKAVDGIHQLVELS